MNLLWMHRKIHVQLQSATHDFNCPLLDDVCVLSEVRYVLMREPKAKNESDLLGELKKHEKKVHCSESAWEIWP